MPTVGVVLSGCGVYDGSEIHEAVLTLLALDRAGATIKCMAPNMEQREVINHLTGEKVAEKRNVLVESARIARGDILDIAKVHGDELDALIFPGGYGAAKNLCDFAYEGTKCVVHPEVERLVQEMVAKKKPVGFICIAPALAARILGAGVSLTIGTDEETAKALEAMGARHVKCPVENIVTDKERKIVTTPAYMLAGSIKEAAEGIQKLVQEVLNLI